MKIWIDLRFIKNDLYSNFVIQLVKSMIETEKNKEYIIYSNKEIEWIDKNIIKKINIKVWSLKEQIDFLKILKKDNNNLMIFFNHFKPVFYKWEYITFVPTLRDIYYMNFDSYFKRYKYLYLMEKNLKKSYKIVCLDQNTKKELIEKFNINENKINILDWFFPEIAPSKKEKKSAINLQINAKYNIKNDYFIYSWGDSIEKNYEKLINVFQRLKKDWKKVDLVFLWDAISKNINLRKLILQYNLEKNCHFLWNISFSEKETFYKKSMWTIFPSFYEPFPFRLAEPLHFWSIILSSNLKNIKDIFWEKIEYFSPISVNSIYEKINNFIENSGKIKNKKYTKAKKNYTIENTTKQLLEIIK